MAIKLILADNQPVFRTGTARFMAVEDDFRIVGQCDDLARLYKAAESTTGTIIAFASSLEPDLQKLVDAAHATKNRLLVILERGESPQRYLGHKIEGIIFRDVTREDMVKCFRAVATGGSFLQQPPLRAMARFETDMVGERVRSRLSGKELQIIRLIVRGYKNKDIARELNNSEQVIKNYLRSIFDKTGVSDRLELALFTMHHRILLEAVEGGDSKSSPKKTAPAAAEADPAPQASSPRLAGVISSTAEFRNAVGLH